MKRPTGLQARASISCSACSRGRVIPQKRPFLESSCAQEAYRRLYILLQGLTRFSALQTFVQPPADHAPFKDSGHSQVSPARKSRGFLYLIRICDSNFHKKICTSDSQVFPAHKSFFSFKSSGYDDTLVSLVK